MPEYVRGKGYHIMGAKGWRKGYVSAAGCRSEATEPYIVDLILCGC